jgi:hypothetical protein
MIYGSLAASSHLKLGKGSGCVSLLDVAQAAAPFQPEIVMFKVEASVAISKGSGRTRIAG